MEKSTKKKLLIGGSVLVIAGVGGYFLFKYLKKKKEEAEKKKADEAAAALAAATPSVSSGGGGGGGGSTNYGPFKSSDEVKAFQDWLDTKYPTWLKGGKLNKGSGYGSYGPSTTSAYATYGKEYSGSTAKDPALEDAIAHLVSKGLSESGLRLVGKDYVIAWATANKAGQATFVLSGKYYDAKTGNATSAPQATGESAIGKMAYPSGAYANVRSSASSASGAFDNTFIGQINSPNVIGKIKNLTFGADKKRWYELDLLTPLAASTTGLVGLNPYAKTGWVREDAITIK